LSGDGAVLFSMAGQRSLFVPPVRLLFKQGSAGLPSFACLDWSEVWVSFLLGFSPIFCIFIWFFILPTCGWFMEAVHVEN